MSNNNNNHNNSANAHQQQLQQQHDLSLLVQLIRSSIFLNNAAVNLLHKGHTTKALHTFKNLVGFLHLYQQEQQQQQLSTTTRATTSLSSLHQDLQSQVQTTAKQVASATCKFSSERRSISSSSRIVDVQIMDDYDHEVKHEACIYGASSSLVFVLRLSDDLLQQHQEEQQQQQQHLQASTLPNNKSMSNFQYMTSAILYNFGVAYLCAHQQHQYAERNSINNNNNSSSKHSLLKAAVQTLRSSQMLLWGSVLQRKHVLQEQQQQQQQAYYYDEEEDEGNNGLYELYTWDLLLQLLRQALYHVEGELHKAVKTSNTKEEQQQQRQDPPRPECTLVHPDEAEYVQAMYSSNRNKNFSSSGLKTFIHARMRCNSNRSIIIYLSRRPSPSLTETLYKTRHSSQS